MAGHDSTPYGVIYCIENSVNGKKYIGQTVGSVEKRWKNHISDKTGCRLLKNAIAKYGVNAFCINVVYEAYSKEELNLKEVEFINLLNTRDRAIGYNLNPGGKSGKQHKETIELRAAALRGKPLSEEHRRKLSDSHLGNKHSEESKAKMSASRKGMKRPRTDEHAAKISKALTGKKRGPMSEEHKEKIRLANIGKKRSPMSEEQKQKRSEKMKGRPKNWSAEGRERTLAASRLYWEQYRIKKAKQII